MRVAAIVDIDPFTGECCLFYACADRDLRDEIIAKYVAEEPDVRDVIEKAREDALFRAQEIWRDRRAKKSPSR